MDVDADDDADEDDDEDDDDDDDDDDVTDDKDEADENECEPVEKLSTPPSIGASNNFSTKLFSSSGSFSNNCDVRMT